MPSPPKQWIGLAWLVATVVCMLVSIQPYIESTTTLVAERKLKEDKNRTMTTRNSPTANRSSLCTFRSSKRPSNTSCARIFFRTYGSGPYRKARERLVRDAQSIGWFDDVAGLQQSDLPRTFRKTYSSVLSRKRGGGYWIWKVPILAEALEEMEDGDVLLYADAGCDLNPEGASRFRGYLDLLDTSHYGMLSFQLPSTESRYTNDRVFETIFTSYSSRYDAPNNRSVGSSNHQHDNILQSGQYIATILLLQKCEHVMAWFRHVQNLLKDDPEIFTDKYNAATHRLDFVDNRHDQSVFSVTRKLWGSVVLPDETWPAGQKEAPIWASRRRSR